MNKPIQLQKFNFHCFCFSLCACMCVEICNIGTCLRFIQVNSEIFFIFINLAWTGRINACWLSNLIIIRSTKADSTVSPSFHNTKRISRAFIIIVTLCRPVNKTDLINCKSCQLWQEAFSLLTRERWVAWTVCRHSSLPPLMSLSHLRTNRPKLC